MPKFFITGGAGFIGSHFCNHLLTDPNNTVTVYDNFSSGHTWHLSENIENPNLTIINNDVANLPALVAAITDHDIVIHLASNPDIAAAANNPQIDFYQGTLLTNNVVEAMRQANVPKLWYASGSGVYGDLGEIEADEQSPTRPISTYGASKLAGEALIQSYTHMFGLTAAIFRFGNVVGARQTHGVGFDFLRRLKSDPTKLRILGDGNQSKTYVHVTDVVKAVIHGGEHVQNRKYDIFNVSTGDYITVNQIAQAAISTLGLETKPKFTYSGGKRGWSGDVPVVRLSSKKLNAAGWSCSRTSLEAITASLRSMLSEI